MTNWANKSRKDALAESAEMQLSPSIPSPFMVLKVANEQDECN